MHRHALRCGLCCRLTVTVALTLARSPSSWSFTSSKHALLPVLSASALLMCGLAAGLATATTEALHGSFDGRITTGAPSSAGAGEECAVCCVWVHPLGGKLTCSKLAAIVLPCCRVSCA